MSKFTDDLYKASKDPFNHPVESMILMELMEPEPTRKDLINKYGDAYLEWEAENDHFRQAPRDEPFGMNIVKKYPDGTTQKYFAKNTYFTKEERAEVEKQWEKDLKRWKKNERWENIKMFAVIVWACLIVFGPIGILLYVINY